MCGIVGYIGHREAYPILIKGLQRLEYRGYDSSGVALMSNGQINLFKKHATHRAKRGKRNCHFFRKKGLKFCSCRAFKLEAPILRTIYQYSRNTV